MIRFITLIAATHDFLLVPRTHVTRGPRTGVDLTVHGVVFAILRLSAADKQVSTLACRRKKPGLLQETGLRLAACASDQPRVRERIMKLS
jgi:hypothetical protein